jgi:hypothetical protein
MNIFDFTEEDLKSNQRGHISPRQREWLNMTARGIRSSSWTSVSVTVGFLFLGLCIILALYLQNEDSRAALFSNPLNLQKERSAWMRKAVKAASHIMCMSAKKVCFWGGYEPRF